MFTPIDKAVVAGLGVAAGLGLAVGGYAYAAMWPGSRIFGRALTAPPRPGELALTFDDGPNPAWTPRLLDTLAAYNVRATFFMVGSYAEVQVDLVQRIAAAGHLIGNHSWSHPNLAISSAKRIRDQLTWTQDTLQQITGEPVRYFRPPFGGRRPAVFRIARSLGLVPVLWNAITADWSQPSAEEIAHQMGQKIDRHQHRGYATNIVLHDGGHLYMAAYRAPSVAAAGLLLQRYSATHRFVTLDAWNADVTPKNGQ